DRGELRLCEREDRRAPGPLRSVAVGRDGARDAGEDPRMDPDDEGEDPGGGEEGARAVHQRADHERGLSDGAPPRIHSLCPSAPQRITAATLGATHAAATTSQSTAP